MVSRTADINISNWDDANVQNTQNMQTPQNHFKGFVDGSSSMGGVWTNIPYLADISFPTLTGITYGLSDQTNGMREEPQYSPQNAYFDSFAANLENLIQKYDLSEEQVNKLVLSFMTEAPVDDTFLEGVLAELDAQIAADIAELFDLPSTTDQGRHLKRTAENHIGSLSAKISELQAYADSLPEGSEKERVQQQINDLTQNINGFKEKMGTLSEPASREELANLAKELSGSGEQLKQIADNLTKLGGNNTELRNVLANFVSDLSDAVESLNGVLQEFVISWQISTGDYSSLTESFKKTFINSLTYEFDNAFESALEQFTGDPALQAKLRYAHFHPDSATGDLKTVLKQVQLNAINQLNDEDWDIPKGYIPPSNSSSFDAAMHNNADEIFKKALKSYTGADGKPLTPKQQNIVRNMYYGIVPAEGKLGAVSTQLEALAAAELTAAFGLPGGSPVPKGSFSHTANINGQFQMKFLELLNALSPEQKAAVLQAINTPLNPGVAAETKALLNELFNNALGPIKNQFSLPDSWTPPVGVVKEINKLSSTHTAAARTVTEWEEGMQTALTLTLSSLDGSDQALLINVLKIVSQAIAELKEQIAIMMQIDSALSQKTGKAQLEAALAKVEKMQSSLDKIAKKREGLKKYGILFDILKVVKVVMTLAAAAAGGFLSFVIAIVALTGKDESNLTKLFETIASGVTEAFTPILGEELAKFAGLNANVMVCCAIVGSGATVMGAQVFFENSGVIQMYFTDLFGCDEMVGEVVAMSAKIVYDIVVGIVLTIITAGAGSALLVASIVGKVATFSAKALKAAAKVLQTIVNQLIKLSQAMSKFAKVSRVIEKVAKQVGKLAEKLKTLADRLVRWSEGVMRKAMRVVQEAKNVKWTKQLRAQFSRKGEVGVPEFDAAMYAYRESIDIVKATIFSIQLVTLVFQAKASMVQVENSLIKEQIARIQADMEPTIAELEAFIKALKQMMAKLLEGLTSTSQWIGQIGQQQGSMWKEYSSTLDAVASANQAG